MQTDKIHKLETVGIAAFRARTSMAERRGAEMGRKCPHRNGRNPGYPSLIYRVTETALAPLSGIERGVRYGVSLEELHLQAGPCRCSRADRPGRQVPLVSVR